MTPIESIHAAYQDCTGLSVNIRVHERSISDYLEHGYTADDMQMVLNYLKREN